MNAPSCACGCGKQVEEGRRGWNRFIHGHHAKGRHKSEDEKRRIGEANSKNMIRFMKDHPDVAKLRGKQLRSQWTDEKEANRIQATKKAYASMSSDDKQKFSVHAQKLWKSGIMEEAHDKASSTFRERSSNGEYDFTERNQKLSEAISQKYVDGTWQFAKGFYESFKTGKKHYFRSSWERTLMQQLDDDPQVSFWESEFTSLPYEHAGAIHRYVPDFHVVRNDQHMLVEVKPEALRDSVRNQAKRRAAQSYCLEMGWKYIEWSPDVGPIWVLILQRRPDT